MNPYRELHDRLARLADKQLGTSQLCDCAMGKILPEHLRMYRSSVIKMGSDIHWRTRSIEDTLTPLGFTPRIAYEIEEVNDLPGRPSESRAARYTRVLDYLKERIE